MNSFDWLAQLDIADVDPFDFVEVSFKNGARKAFFRSQPFYRPVSGDMVVVDVGGGFDIGRVTLSGELVRLQMKKRRTNPDSILFEVIRKANERDLERLEEARDLERPTMIEARAIARSLGLDMKVGDVEYQGDKRKATFYYTANGRVDFRELIRQYAKEFRVKIEMRQIGARQESARIGGLGSCGRELCCSTWLTDFKSVSTGAARYQNLAINQSKLSGQCGRLKCCLNYELDTYMDALESFPEKADRLHTEAGMVVLVKTDIFKQLMFYTYYEGPAKGKLFPLAVKQVWEMQALNREGKKPADLEELAVAPPTMADSEPDYEDVTGFIELPPEERKKKRKKKRKKGPGEENSGKAPAARPSTPQPPKKQPEGRKPADTNREEARKEPKAPPAHHAPRHEKRLKEHKPPTQPPAAGGAPKPMNPPTGNNTPPPGAQKPPAATGEGNAGATPNPNRNNNNNKRRRGNRRGRSGDKRGGGDGES
jgi:cell fate regulator YaaT (PSP1 superfamily)